MVLLRSVLVFSAWSLELFSFTHSLPLFQSVFMWFFFSQKLKLPGDFYFRMSSYDAGDVLSIRLEIFWTKMQTAKNEKMNNDNHTVALWRWAAILIRRATRILWYTLCNCFQLSCWVVKQGSSQLSLLGACRVACRADSLCMSVASVVPATGEGPLCRLSQKGPPSIRVNDHPYSTYFFWEGNEMLMSCWGVVMNFLETDWLTTWKSSV